LSNLTDCRQNANFVPPFGNDPTGHAENSPVIHGHEKLQANFQSPAGTKVLE